MNLYEVNKILHLHSHFQFSLSKPKSLIYKNLGYLKKTELKFFIEQKSLSENRCFLLMTTITSHTDRLHSKSPMFSAHLVRIKTCGTNQTLEAVSG